jgi:RNA polymerase sigma-70 factor (ECF subfamily)
MSIEATRIRAREAIVSDFSLESDPHAGAAKSAQNTDRLWSAWMAAAQAGDKTAYETLLRNCIPFIKRVARNQGVHPDNVDDVVQETLLTIHGARQTYDPSRSFSVWLRVIAQRRAIDGLRRSGRTSAREVHAPLAYENHPDGRTSPEAAVFELDRTVLFKAALAALPAAQRDVVDRLALQGQPVAHAAIAAGRTTGSLRISWHRAIKSLRTHIKEKD